MQVLLCDRCRSDYQVVERVLYQSMNGEPHPRAVKRDLCWNCWNLWMNEVQHLIERFMVKQS